MNTSWFTNSVPSARNLNKSLFSCHVTSTASWLVSIFLSGSAARVAVEARRSGAVAVDLRRSEAGGAGLAAGDRPSEGGTVVPEALRSKAGIAARAGVPGADTGVEAGGEGRSGVAAGGEENMGGSGEPIV